MLDWAYKKESVVIFVCDFDLFQKGRSVYTFESVCREDFNIQLNDKRKTVFVNICGKDARRYEMEGRVYDMGNDAAGTIKQDDARRNLVF